jgi:hypothetical protein
VPCPLFLPVSPLGDFAPDAMPLGDVYGGQCAADPGALIPIDTLRKCCNFGYARAACERAATAEPDAARFLIRADRDGTVEVAWSLERNHHPVAVGVMQLTGAGASEDPLERQARACAASWLRHVGKA